MAAKEKIFFNTDPNISEKEYLESAYIITRDGCVIRRFDGKKMTPVKDYKGYLRIRLKSPRFSKNKDLRKPYKVHRLVAMFYLDNYSEDLQVNHKNGIKTDNRVENLEMVTNRENVIHAWTCLDTTVRMEKLNKRRDKRTGRFVSKEYFDKGCERFKQETSQLSLFNI